MVTCTQKRAILELKGTLNTILYNSHILGMKETGVQRGEEICLRLW